MSQIIDKFRLAGIPALELVKEKILPDIEGIYSDSDSVNMPSAVILSHAHIDHYGFLGYVRPEVPIFMTSSADELIRLTRINMKLPHIRSDIRHFLKYERFDIDGEFSITPYLMDHSAFDACAFSVEAGGKNIVYTGDFRSHGRKRYTLDKFLRECPRNPDVLIIEGTNMGNISRTRRTEQDLEGEIIDVLKDYEGKTVLCFASSQNIDRMVTLYKACSKAGRIMVVDPYTGLIQKMMSRESSSIPHPGYRFKNLKVSFKNKFYSRIMNNYGENKGETKKLLESMGKRNKIDLDFINADPGKFLVMINTTMLSLINELSGIESSALIYSLWSGYLKMNSTEWLRNLTESKHLKLHNIHSSGHADPETLKKIIDELQPRMVIPVHTKNPDFFAGMTDKVKICKIPADGERVAI